MDEAIRESVRQVMEQRGVSQADLARQLGISPQALHDVISGKRGRIPQSLVDIMDALGARLAVQFDG